VLSQVCIDSFILLGLIQVITGSIRDERRDAGCPLFDRIFNCEEDEVGEVETAVVEGADALELISILVEYFSSEEIGDEDLRIEHSYQEADQGSHCDLFAEANSLDGLESISFR